MICKDVFKAYDLAHVIVLIYGFTHAIVCLFKRCYKADYSYYCIDFLYDLAYGLIIGRLVVSVCAGSGLIGLFCLILLSTPLGLYFCIIILLQELSFIKPEYCMAGNQPYEYTPWSPRMTGHILIRPGVTEDQ